MHAPLFCLLPLVLVGCSKSNAARVEGEPPPAVAPSPAPSPARVAPAVTAPPLIAGTRVAWPPSAPGRWVGVTVRAGFPQLVAADGTGAVRDIAGGRFEGEEYIEVDDTFQLTPIGDTLIVARSMAKLTEAYRDVFLLVDEGGTVRVAQHWSGLEGERAPFEPAPLPPDVRADDAFRWTRGTRSLLVTIEARGGKATLVTYDDANRATAVTDGSFASFYDRDSITMIYLVVGDRLVVRMSSAANIADNCESLLVDAPAGRPAAVVARWRGSCSARAPFEPAQ